MGFEMVVFGEDWGRHPSSTQHLMQHLQDQISWLWVNSIGLRAPRFTVYDLKRSIHKLKAMLPALKTTNQPSTHPDFVINPWALPLSGQSWLSQLNGHLIAQSIQRQRTLQRPIVWTSLPSAVDVLGKLNESAVVYYCGDDFSHLAGVDHALIQAKERQLVEAADLIITASEVLAAKFPKTKTRVLTHGVDLALFQKPYTRPDDLPNAALIAGFYGSIDAWFNQDLLQQVALQQPKWQFVLIGPIKVNIDKLLALPNVHWLGVKAHHQLASYVQHWQVSLLPFRHVPQIQACNPLKLREYLAVGTPILSTDFPALSPFKIGVHVSDCAHDWSDYLANLAYEPDHQVSLRRHLVSQESWQQKSQLLGHWLAQLVGDAS